MTAGQEAVCRTARLAAAAKITEEGRRCEDRGAPDRTYIRSGHQRYDFMMKREALEAWASTWKVFQARAALTDDQAVGTPRFRGSADAGKEHSRGTR